MHVPAGQSLAPPSRKGTARQAKLGMTGSSAWSCALAFLVLLSVTAALQAGYVEDRAAAVRLMSQRKADEALKALVEAAAGELNDIQKSDALALAAECARMLKDHGRAEELAGRIPGDAMAGMATMQNLVAQGKYRDLVDRFGREDLTSWPAYPARAAHLARGKAYAAIEQGAAAEEDFQRALELMNEKRIITELHWRIGQNRRTSLEDPEGALQAYRQAVARTDVRGYYMYYNCVLAAASILREQGRHDEALETLDQMRPDEQGGSWRGAVFTAIGDTLAAAGRREEAIAAYRDVLANEQAHKAHREQAKAGLERLEE